MSDTQAKSKKWGFKKITDYDDDELRDTILDAVEECKVHDLDFYAILRGVDAYQEKRRRKVDKAEGK